MIESIPAEELDYGIEHYDGKGSPASNMTLSNYEPIQSPEWAIKREKYNILATLDSIKNKIENKPTPSVNKWFQSVGVIRKFILSSREDRKEILVKELGFIDTGIAIGDSTKFVYHFSLENSQIQLYMSTNELGEINELNKYLNAENIEIKAPIDPTGLQHLFFEVFNDLCFLNFNQMDLSILNEEESQMNYMMMDLSNEVDFIDSTPVSEFINLFGGIASNNPKDIWSAIANNESEEISNIISEDTEQLDGQIDTNLSIIAQVVNERIQSPEVALQLVLEFLEFANHGDEAHCKFVRESGFTKNEYIGAINNSFIDHSDTNGPGNFLMDSLMLWLGDEEEELFYKYRLLIFEKIMQHWSLGKYKNK